MAHRLRQSARGHADAGTFASALLLAVAGIRYALGEGWTVATILFAAAGAIVAWRLLRGPSLGPVVIEISDDELVLTLTFYVPTRTLRFPLAPMRTLRVVGPDPGRRFRIEMAGGEVHEVRPFFGPFLAPRAIDFLRLHLPPHVELVEEKPAGLLAQVRGNY